MDITFTCTCGQNIVIDEAGAGITTDCPQCGQPAYVPSNTPAKAKDIPVRVQTATARPTPVATTVARTSRQSAAPVTTPKREDIHPSIRASLACLLIIAGIALVSLIMMQQNFFAAMPFFYMTVPFITAAPLCAIYGMCVGHVKHGLLLLGVMSLMICLSCWIALHTMFGQLPQFPH